MSANKYGCVGHEVLIVWDGLNYTLLFGDSVELKGQR
jgi:hypothetical protein